MRPARLYLRRSREEQSGYSPAAQEREAHAYCAAHDYTVVATYIDDDVSGTRRSRPALDRLRAEAQRGDVVVIHHFDRLGRDAAFLLDLVYRQLALAGVTVESVQGGVDPYSEIGKLLLTVQGGVAEYYVDNLRREIRKGLQEKAKQGGWVGGLPQGYTSTWDHDPRGLRIRGTGRAILDDDAPTVVELFERYATGNESTRTLAIDLNARGVTARGRYGRVAWSADLVSAVLANSFYTGVVRYRGQELPGQHEPLIDRDLFDRVQAIRARRNRGGGRSYHDHKVGLLSEIGRCVYCDSPMHWIGLGSGYRSYMCRSRRKTGACSARAIRADLVDEQVMAWLRGFTIPDWIRPLVIDAAQQLLQAPTTGPDIDRAAVEGAIRRLDRVYAAGGVSDQEWEQERGRLAALLVDAPTARPRLLDLTRALALLGDIGAMLDQADPLGRRALTHAVVAGVWLGDGVVHAIQPAPSYGLLIQAVRAAGVGQHGDQCDSDWSRKTLVTMPQPVIQLWRSFQVAI